MDHDFFPESQEVIPKVIALRQPKVIDNVPVEDCHVWGLASHEVGKVHVDYGVLEAIHDCYLHLGAI